MEFQLQFITNPVSFLSPLLFLKKFYSQDQDHLPPAAVLDQNSDNPPPNCAICLDDICGGERYRKLSECRHSFHAHCIDLWFQSHSTCPLCRVQVPQIISLTENQYQWSVLMSGVLLLLQDFFEKMSNPPLNDELSSMVCGNVRCVS